MKAQDLMTAGVRTCAQGDSLEQAARMMWDSDIGCLVVTDGDQKPLGMVTDRDIAMAAYTQGVPLRDASVGSAMSRQLVTCSPNTSLHDLENTMRSSQIRRIPVVAPDGKLLGIVGLGDIARSSQSGPLRVKEMPGLAKMLVGVTERRWAKAAE